MLYCKEISFLDIPRNISRYTLGIALLILSWVNLNAQEIAVYYDPGYVDNCSNNTCEAFTLNQFLGSISYQTETFDGLDSVSFFNALSCKDVFFLPETEAGDFADDLDQLAKTVIQDFVSSGGLMFVMGSDGFNPSSSNSARNLNSIFGFDINNDLFTSSGFSYRNNDASVGYLNSIPDSVRNFTTTNFISNIPSGAEVLYKSTGGENSVVDIPYGDGHIVFLGWSFFNGGPIGNQGPDRWSLLIQGLINNLTSPTFYPNCFFCDQTPPVLRAGASRNFNGFFDTDGFYDLSEGLVKPRYEDNCGDFEVSFLFGDQLRCIEGEEQEVYIELEDEQGNSVVDTLIFMVRDTTAPVFTSIPQDITVECNTDLAPSNLDTLDYIDIIDLDLDIDSFEIIEIPLSGWRLPSGAQIERTEVLIDGEFNDLSYLWIRARAVPGNSSLLYDGNCVSKRNMDSWFSSTGDALDCNQLNQRRRFRSVNGDLNRLSGAAVDSFVLDVLNLGNLTGRINQLGLRFIFRSELKLPTVEEACGYELSYSDMDNRGDCPIGNVIRRFEVTDDFGNSDEGFQIITVVDSKPLDIQFPDDYHISCKEGMNLSGGLHPDSLPLQYAYPVVTDECQEYVVRYSDQLVSNCGIHDQTYIRTWNIFSECDPDTNYIHRQELRIIDTVAPEIESLLTARHLVFVDDESCLAGNNFTYPSLDSFVIEDCDSDPTIVMRVLDSSGVEFNPRELGVGNYFVEVSATDECGNQGIELVPVEYFDQIPPEVVCKSGPNIEIKLNLDINGHARTCGRDLINPGLTDDNCGIAGYQVNFIQSFNSSLECLDVDCSNLGLVTLFVRGEDFSGNSDVCSLEVEIVDEIAPQILCTDIIIPCDAPFDEENYPPPVAVDNCDANLTYICDPFGFIGGFCDSVYVRNCRVIDASGNESRCTQFLRREDTSSIRIDWPEQLVELNCDADPSPNVAGSPQVSSSCTPYDIQYQDNRSILCGSPDLFRIERQWFVRNLCNQDLETFTQEILVTDLDPPIFTNPSQTYVELTIPGFSCDMMVNLEAEAIDDCSSVVNYSNSVNGSGRTLSGRFDRGEHEVVFYATDLCGNTDSIIVTLSIKENKNPFIECRNNQDFYLNQVEFVDIYPEMMIDTVFDLCTDRDSLRFFISKVLDNGQDIGRQPFIRYRCADLGINKIRLFARDQDGNIGSCDANLQVIDTLSNCPNGNFFDIGGMIFSELRNPIGGAVALLNQNRYLGRDLGLNGEYIFRRLPTDSCYEVSVEKDSTALNGITAMDLALIRRHILNLGFIRGPYQIIAGDVNNNEAISTTDIAILRALILGITDEFEFVPSWRFVPESHEFLNPQNPFDHPIPYADTVCLENESALFVNFIGFKMGDVNSNADLSRSGDESRSQALGLQAKYKYLSQDRYLVEFTMAEPWLTGQVFLEFDENSIVDWHVDDYNGPENYLHTGADFLNMVYDDDLSKNNDVLLRLHMTLRQNASLKDVISLNTVNQNLAAIEWNSERKVALEWWDDQSNLSECLSAVPNLWSTSITIKNTCFSGFNYRVLNSYGHVLQEGWTDEHSSSIGKADWPSGLYLIEARRETGQVEIFKTIKTQ
ncbi:MAG TPA: hypothetical protein VJ917_05785 [Saprospiraceae bacterium]|nr:hypothetical protein [Saprospiraceae bacterium]